MIIRPEEEKDYKEVENLIREAFWNVYRPGCTEHFVMHNLRKETCFVPELDYLIEDSGRIVAHIAYATGSLVTNDSSEEKMLLFGPVSVLPAFQGKGYGSYLIRHTLRIAKNIGYPAVVISGAPDYYHRFGFESASKHGIYLEGMGNEQEADFFMIKIFDKNTVIKYKGTYRDPDCYFADQNLVDEYDKQFSPKIKEKRPGQLFQ